MYLVDTSVWIDFIQGRDTPAVELLDQLLENPLAVGINNQIYLEILQGAKSSQAFDTLKNYFGGQRFYDFENAKESHAEAARIYAELRGQGTTVRSSLDCLIAQCAIENEVVLLHRDQDYINMQKTVPELKQQHFL